MTDPFVEYVQNPDRRRLSRFIVAYTERVTRLVRRIVRCPEASQDVVQDAFVAVWEKAATYEPARGSVFSWALTLVRNRAIDRLRLTRRRADLLAGAAAADVAGFATAAGLSGREAATARDDATTVRVAVAGLAPEQQLALELAFFGGLTQEQIAEKLGEPLGTVKARIRRGLLELRETLGGR